MKLCFNVLQTWTEHRFALEKYTSQYYEKSLRQISNQQIFYELKRQSWNYKNCELPYSSVKNNIEKENELMKLQNQNQNRTFEYYHSASKQSQKTRRCKFQNKFEKDKNNQNLKYKVDCDVAFGRINGKSAQWNSNDYVDRLRLFVNLKTSSGISKIRFTLIDENTKTSALLIPKYENISLNDLYLGKILKFKVLSKRENEKELKTVRLVLAQCSNAETMSFLVKRSLKLIKIRDEITEIIYKYDSSKNIRENDPSKYLSLPSPLQFAQLNITKMVKHLYKLCELIGNYRPYLKVTFLYEIASTIQVNL